jgi:divalent metal cation (Fe/Co/Zn/Cd) transporter
LIIFLGPFLAKDKAPKGFWWVGIGGVLISIGGIALAFVTSGSQLLFFKSMDDILNILAPLLLLMTLAFTWGFVKQIKAG